MRTGEADKKELDASSDSLMNPELSRGEHILMIAAHFAPESTSGTHRSLHFARGLRDAGYRVSVVTLDYSNLASVDPSLNEVFPDEDQILRVPISPTLESTYLALKKPLARLRRAVRKGQRAQAGPPQPVAGSTDHRNNLRRELSGIISFPDRYRGWYRPALSAANVFAARSRVDAVFASGPPWTSLMVAHAAARQYRCKLMVDFRDPWTLRMGFPDPDQPRVFAQWAEREETKIIGRSEAVLFNSPDLMANARRNILNLPPLVQCLLNGTDVPARPQRVPFPAGDNLVIRHLGSLYGGRSVTPLVDGIAGARAIDKSRLRIELIGPRDTGFAPEGAHEREGIAINSLPSVPYAVATRLMAEPAILLVVQSRKFSAQIPTKIYEYLRTGNPILVLAAADSALWRFASKFARCFRLDFDDSAANATMIQELFTDWASGRLSQTPTSDDTAALGKGAIGQDFVSLMSRVLASGSVTRNRKSRPNAQQDPEIAVI